MARISFKKKAIPVDSRRQVAMRYGCKPGEAVAAKCPCGFRGEIIWHLSGRQKLGWVQFFELELDHKVPEFLGGSSESSNLELLCRRCNRSKGHKHEG